MEINNANMIRQDIIGELEAVNQYEQHILMTQNSMVKKILHNIVDEEKVHIGKLFTLLTEIDPHSAELFLNGEEEAKNIIEMQVLKRR